jgi:hypothetical protein
MRDKLNEIQLVRVANAFRNIAGVGGNLDLPPIAGFAFSDNLKLELLEPNEDRAQLSHIEIARKLGDMGLRGPNKEVTGMNIITAAKVGAFVISESLKNPEPPVKTNHLRQIAQHIVLASVSLGAKEVVEHKRDFYAIDRILNPNPRISGHRDKS